VIIHSGIFIDKKEYNLFLVTIFR